MDCRSCTEALTALIDQELSEIEQDEVMRHIAACASCREEYESLLETTRFAASLPFLEVPAALWSTIQQRLEGEGAEALRVPWWAWFTQRPWIPVSAAAGLALLLAGGAVFFDQPDPLESQYRQFIELREQTLRQHWDVLRNRERLQQLRTLRNPFSVPVSLSNSNPFRE
ncbi:MAG: hypothetical protein Kow00109_29070 [Acidobacteriota bacterium]